MNEAPVEWDGQSKEEVPSRRFLSLYPWGVLHGVTAVCGNAAYGAYVSRQWREPRSSHPSGQDLLR